MWSSMSEMHIQNNSSQTVWLNSAIMQRYPPASYVLPNARIKECWLFYSNIVQWQDFITAIYHLFLNHILHLGSCLQKTFCCTSHYARSQTKKKGGLPLFLGQLYIPTRFVLFLLCAWSQQGPIQPEPVGRLRGWWFFVLCVCWFRARQSSVLFYMLFCGKHIWICIVLCMITHLNLLWILNDS